VDEELSTGSLARTLRVSVQEIFDSERGRPSSEQIRVEMPHMIDAVPASNVVRGSGTPLLKEQVECLGW
jgi:hypothetical protein